MRTMQDIENLVANLRCASRPDAATCSQSADLIERMAAWLAGDCQCPCCLGTEECKPGCTFAEDAPSDAERMANVRDVMFGEMK